MKKRWLALMGFPPAYVALAKADRVRVWRRVYRSGINQKIRVPFLIWIVTETSLMMAFQSLFRSADHGITHPVLMGVLSAVFQLTGTVLFVRFAVTRLRPDLFEQINRYCLECGYDLTGNASGRCPECGRECLRNA